MKQSFEYAFLTLNEAVAPQNAYLIKENQSILGRIIRITEEVSDYREWIYNSYLNRPIEKYEGDLASAFRSPEVKNMLETGTAQTVQSHTVVNFCSARRVSIFLNDHFYFYLK